MNTCIYLYECQLKYKVGLAGLNNPMILEVNLQMPYQLYIFKVCTAHLLIFSHFHEYIKHSRTFGPPSL